MPRILCAHILHIQHVYASNFLLNLCKVYNRLLYYYIGDRKKKIGNATGHGSGAETENDESETEYNSGTYACIIAGKV